MAQRCQIPVYWILPPGAPDRGARLERTGASAAYRKFVEDCVARFSCLKILDGWGLGYGAGAFRDRLHVNRDGAIRLSVAVAGALAPLFCGNSSNARWIKLAAIDDQEASEYQKLVEDLDESRAAIEPIIVGQNSKEGTAW